MARILLESQCHADNAFVTLTYEKERRSLVPSDLTNWLKRLRRAHPGKLRYFACGEYGSLFQRPHYHAAVFGLSRLQEKLVADTWGLGFVNVGELNAASAAYIAGYVTKKMEFAGAGDLEGREPEFQRMSLRPHGIGGAFIPGLGAQLTNEVGSVALSRLADVPREVRIGGKLYPMGRYLQGKLREAVGWDSKMPEVQKEILKAKELALTDVERVEKEVHRERQYDKAIFYSKLEKQQRSI